MDDVIGRAWYELAARNERLEKDLREAEAKIKASGASGASGFEKSYSTASQKVTTAFKGVGLALAAIGVGVGLSTAIGFFKDAVDSASALEESINKVDVVFGASAGAIQEWAANSADAFGQSNQQALEAVGTYGNLFQAFGLGVEESSKMSQKLVELAADLASFNNTPVDDALNALRSGLSGETEPLKRFGVALNDARMRAVLADQGVENLGATLTAAQKATAAYAIIMHDTALAQGDFARTSDGLANQQRQLAADVENLKAEFGALAVPVLTDLIEVAREWVDLLGGMTGQADESSQSLKEWADAGESLGSILGIAGYEAQAGLSLAAYAVENLGGTVQTTLVDGAETTRVAAAHFISGIYTETDAARRKALEAVQAMPSEIAAALIAGTDDVKTGLETLTTLMNDEWTDASRVAYLKGVLTSEELQAGLVSEDADVRATAKQIKEDAEAELRLLESGAYDAAVDAGVSVQEGLRSQLENTGNAAAEVKSAAQNVLEFGDESDDWGRTSIEAWINGMREMWGAAHAAAIYLGTAVSGPLRGESPPKEGPLHEIDRWGAAVGEAYAQNLLDGIADTLRGGLVGPGQVLSSLGGSAGISASLNGTVTVRHVIDDPSGSLAAVGGTREVAAALADGLNAAGVVAYLRHEAGIP